jgi:hypothetical protein
MDQQMDLHVDITGDASSAETAVNVSQETLDKLEASIQKLVDGIEPLNGMFAKLQAGSTEAGAGLDKTTASATQTGESLRALGAQTGMAARGFEALGLGASESAARVEALAGALDGMTRAVPGLVAIGAVLSAAFSGFSTLKEGVKDASDFENAIRELSIMALAGGQATAGMADKVRKWSEAMAEAAGVSEEQTVPAVLRLVDAGQSAGGAMTIVTVAQQMVAAGMGNLRGSTDMAESSTQRLNQVLRAFYLAMDGNYSMIARMDPAVRKLVEAHAPLPVIIAAINDQTKEAIEKNNGNAMAWDRLHGIIAVTAKDIGSDLLPMLTATARYLYGLEATLGDVGKAWIDWASNSLQSIGNVLVGLEHLGHAMVDMTTGNWKDIGSQEGLGLQHLASAGRNVANIFGDMRRTGTDFFSAGSAGAAHLSKELGILHKQAQDYSDIIDAPYKTTSKGGGTGYNAPASSYQQDLIQRTQAQTAATSEEVRVTDALTAAKNKASEIENIYANAVKLSTSGLQQEATQHALDLLRVSSANQLYLILSNAIRQESDSLASLTAEHKVAGAEYERLNARLNDHLHGLEGAKKESILTKEETAKLTAAVADAKAHYEDTGRAVTTVTNALKTHRAELVAAGNASRDAADKEGEDLAALTRKWNDFTQKQAVDEEDANAKRTVSGQKLLAFYTNQYELDYQLFQTYKKLGLTYLTGEYETQTEDAYRKMTAEQDQLYQQDYQNRKQWTDKAQSTVTSFLDQMLTGNKSLRDNLKSVFDGILKDFTSMIDQMVAKSLLMDGWLQKILGGSSSSNPIDPYANSIGNWFFGTGGGMGSPSSQRSGSPLGQNAVQSAVAGAGSYGVLGALLGPQGASQVIAAISAGGSTGIGGHSGGAGSSSITINAPNSAAVAGAAAGPSVGAGAAATAHGGASALGGPSGASAGGKGLGSAFTGSGASSLWSAASSLLGGGGGGGGGLSNTFGGNPSDAVYGGPGAPAYDGSAVAGSGSTMLSGLKIGGVGIGNLLMGAMAGSFISNMLDHGNQDASIGGMIGGAGGAMLGSLLGKLFLTGGAAAGPLGMIVGSLLGALVGTELGGLFGDHFPKANEPDIYQTQAWGQELADMQGSTSGNPMIANGQNFVMDSNTSSETAGQGWNVMIESFVAKFRQNQKQLPTELQAGFPMLESLWGGAQNTADFNGNGKNGMLQIGSGTTAAWTTFWGYISAYGPAIAQIMAMYTPTDLYAASLNGSVSQLGGYTPSGDPWLLHAFPDFGTAGGGSQAPAVVGTPGGSKRTVTNINVYQQFGGSLIAESAMNERILKTISMIPGFTQADLVGT